LTKPPTPNSIDHMLNSEQLPGSARRRSAAAGKTAAKVDVEAAAKRTRLLPHERERQIVEAAVRFFAEQGFEGQMRELARRIGITNGLLFNYFPTKAALLDRVYSEVFESRWNPAWEGMLADPALPLRDKLIDFYVDYARVVHSAEWVRTFLYAGLAGLDVNRRYRTMLKRSIYTQVINETRRQHGLPAVTPDKLPPIEEELVTALHGMIFHAGIRQWVYGYEVLPARERVALNVDMFLGGARAIYGEPPTPAARRKER
jgi:AcrR family transcriptional regulator